MLPCILWAQVRTCCRCLVASSTHLQAEPFTMRARDNNKEHITSLVPTMSIPALLREAHYGEHTAVGIAWNRR